MSGEAAGTSGAPAGTSGAQGFAANRTQLALVAALGLVNALVNATSALLEARREGRLLEIWEPFVWEASSFVVVLALAPLVWRAVEKIPPTSGRMARFALSHAALTIPFSIIHVAAMMALRLIVYAAVGDAYAPFSAGVALTFLYEWRKDALAYAALAGLRIGVQVWAARQASAALAPIAAGGEARVEVRDGAQRLFLAPAEIVSVEAAGNYVEIRTGARTHLVRGALAAFEGRLAPHGFVRVHRSRLVNKAHIRAIRPTGAGDVEIELSDGRTLAGSRRYRAALAGAGT